MRALVGDLRHAGRALLKDLAFTAVAILTLAVVLIVGSMAGLLAARALSRLLYGADT